MKGPRLRYAALSAGALAVLVMVPFEYTVTRIIGVILMLSFVVLGVFAIATPEYLDVDLEDENH